ncbi:MAG TPA: diguanylate cyclase [Thermodesulfovibrionales bacterium]|nr:diguanylate cyclase [Thermodesulfovibrionales bacterium]
MQGHTDLKELVDRLSERGNDSQQSHVELLAGIMSAIGDGISIMDTDFRVIYQNQAHKNMIGDHKGEHCYSAFSKHDKVCDGCPVNLCFRDGNIHKLEKAGKTGNRPLHIEILASSLHDATGKVMAGIEVVRDITEKKVQEEELRALLLVDDLTGLFNRRGFFTLTEHLLKRVKREKKPIFMLYADVDGLKRINDQYGHQAGDQALRDIARILKSTYRESDIIGRISGDEFVVVITAGKSADNAEFIASRLKKNLDMYNATTHNGFTLSLSAGIQRHDPAHPCSIDELLSQADKLMYEQKKFNFQIEH